MADLRIVDAPEIPTENITGEEKLPTGGSGNYSISLDSLADYTKTKKDLADNASVEGKVNGVRQELETHIEDLLNPHQVTKGQIGLGNVDNTADADKPVSNSAQAAIISAVAPKADKTYVDGQLSLKVNKADVDSSLLTKADKTYVDNQLSTKSDKNYTDGQLLLKADKTYVDSQDLLLQSQIDQKATAEYLDSALTEQTQTVNTALSNLSTVASKFYPTLAGANADIDNIAVNQVVNIGEVANGGLWYKATAEATTLTKSPYDPLPLSKVYSDRDKFAPYYAKHDFESGYLETFFDSYKTVNQYVPARYSGGFAQIATGTATKKLPINSGLSIRFKIKYLTYNPLMILGLTDSPNGFVPANNIGIVTGSSLTNAFHFRLIGGVQPIASSLTKEAVYNNTYSMELVIQGGTLKLNRYNDDFSTLVESYSQTIDKTAYENYKYLTLYTQATTYFSLIEINYFNAKTVIDTSKINPNWLGGAASYMLDDWSRRANANASALQSLGRDGQLTSKANIIEVDMVVDTSNTTDGFLIGFGNTATSSDRVAIGYEPAAAYRGLVFLNGESTGASFTRIVPIEQLVNGIYKLVLSKADTYYRYQVYKPDGLLVVDREYQSDLATSRQLYISGKYTTASKTLVKDVRLKLGESLPEKPKASTTGNGFKDLSGRNLVQEQFGGEGNDWCFVYTPPNYSTSGKAHKFVILNHGNGWTVSSNPSTANFSSKTQFGVDTQNGGTYLDTGRADYVQYSSPLIEALLAQGYVVCGATNYADGLYGNKNCRNAVIDFYNYMRKNYNVTDRCHMIGASNGAMTTLNACHLMGASKVASIALLYPLASLFDHYLAYSGHRSAILTAYGLAGNTYANLAALKAEKTFFTHCPVHHYIVGDDLTEQQIKTLALPPMIVYSSTGDTVTAAASNGKKLKDLCDRSSLVCQYTDIDPTGALGYDHGDWHHFNDSEIVNFFKANK